MEKYIIYLRKSQMDRDYDELSVEETLSRHQRILTEYCKQRKLFVDQILKEVVSGESLSGRPQMLKCLELINTGEYTGVVCMDIDRLSRGSAMDSGYIMQVLQINGCKIITPSKVYDLANDSDEQFTDMKFMFSRYELKTIKKRLVRGRDQSAAEGKFLGSVPPYGYEIVKIPHEKGNTLKIKPDEAAIVKMVYHMYLDQNLGQRLISNQLNIPVSTVSNILSNPVYVGKIWWKAHPQKQVIMDGSVKKVRYRKQQDAEIYDGRHEPIISEEDFQKAQEIKKGNYIPPINGRNQMKNPFVGLIVCGKCGRPLCRNVGSVKQHKDHMEWFRCPTAGCNRNIPMKTFEGMVVDSMRDWLKDYTVTISDASTPIKSAKNDLLEALDQLEDKLKKLHEQQDKICDLLEQGVYSVEMFQKRNDTIMDQIADLGSKKEGILKLIQDKSNINENIVPTTQHLLDNYDEFDIQTKNKLWKEVLNKVTAFRDDEGIHIELYPRI